MGCCCQAPTVLPHLGETWIKTQINFAHARTPIHTQVACKPTKLGNNKHLWKDAHPWGEQRREAHMNAALKADTDWTASAHHRVHVSWGSNRQRVAHHQSTYLQVKAHSSASSTTSWIKGRPTQRADKSMKENHGVINQKRKQADKGCCY